jgi:phosphoglycerate dehydrogenase-like enzyme
MHPFRLFFTGDYLDESGAVSYGDIGLDQLHAAAYIETGFLLDQKPQPGQQAYWKDLYSLEIKPEHVARANGIVIFRPWVKASAFSGGAKNLVVLARAGAGYDKIDLGACTENDVAVSNVPDSLTHSTASAALTLMLALAKKLMQQQEALRAGCWDQQAKLYGDDLQGKTLGIIGLGKSGIELARLVAPFHMRLIAFSPRANPYAAESAGVELIPDLNVLLQQSDFVSLHCRLEERTRNLLKARELEQMRPTAYLINVARGELIESAALVQALQQRKIAGAGLDVFDTEPLPLDSPLLSLDNVILTPHWLPSTYRAARATRDSIIATVLRVAQGFVPENVVNPEVIGRPGFRKKLEVFVSNRV